MNAKRILSVLLITITLLAVFSVPRMANYAQQSPQLPEETVQAFYDSYLDYATSGEEFRNPLVDGVYRDSPFLTEHFITQIDEAFASAGDMGMGYDPFLCAQNIPRFVTVSRWQTYETEAKVLVGAYYDSPRANNFTVWLNRLGDDWLIDDIVCGETFTERGIVEDFYNWYIGAWEAVRQGETDVNPIISGTYRDHPALSEAFVEQLDAFVAERSMSVEPGEGDPLLCAQDIPVSVQAYEIDTPVTADPLAPRNVLVHTFYAGNPNPHSFTVKILPFGLIDGVVCDVSPEHIAILLYREYASQTHFNMANNIAVSVFQNPSYHWIHNVSDELKTSLTEEVESCVPTDADPVLCAQDIPFLFSTHLLSSSDSEAVVQMLGAYPSGPDTYEEMPLGILDLEMVNGQWILTRIRCMTVCE